MTRSLRACKPISSLAEFEGTLVLTRRLTRRSHVSSLSVCRHCAAHCVSQFVVKPHGPGRLKISSRPAPQGNHRLHLARSTISPQSNHTPLSLLHTFLRTLQQHWKLSVAADPDGPPPRRVCGRVGGCSTTRRRDSSCTALPFSRSRKSSIRALGHKRESGDRSLALG